MKRDLTMRPIARRGLWKWIGIGKPVAYAIHGLPINQEARIEQHPHENWKVCRTINGQPMEPEGDFETPEDALHNLASKL